MMPEGTVAMATESSGLLVGQDDGRTFINPIGGRMVIKAARSGYSLHENILPPHSPGPRPQFTRSMKRSSTCWTAN